MEAMVTGVVEHDVRVMEDFADPTDELDMSLEPAPERVMVPAPARRGPGLLVLAVVALLGTLALGTAALVVVGAAGVVGALVMFAPTAPMPVLPDVEEVGIEMVTPVIIDTPTSLPSEPEVRTPARAPVTAPSGPVEAELVVMPDPAFKSVPADEAIERLRRKVESGEAGTAVGK